MLWSKAIHTWHDKILYLSRDAIPLNLNIPNYKEVFKNFHFQGLVGGGEGCQHILYFFWGEFYFITGHYNDYINAPGQNFTRKTEKK